MKELTDLKVYVLIEGKPHLIDSIKEFTEESISSEKVIDGVVVASPSEKMMEIQKEFIGSLSVQIDNEAPFIKEIQNQHKKYLRDKAQYKFWKDQELFVANNRAGRRRK